MDYREVAAPPEIAHLASCAWTLDVGDEPGGWATHVATPDGCVEIIRRVSGRSIWGSEQPKSFVAGLITRPAQLRLSAGSRFIGLRIRPWTWNALSGTASRHLIDSWRDLDTLAPALALPEDPLSLISAGLLDPAKHALGKAIVASSSVADLVQRSGLSPRWLQRWFEREIGVPPSTYLRLVRFNETFAELGQISGTLADHAAAHGFADQAHMAREFREMSGTSAAKAKSRALGPFL